MNVKIHREGRNIIIFFFVVLLIINLIIIRLTGASSIWFYSVLLFSIMFFAFVLRFFRNPTRISEHQNNVVYAPCDGKVVVVEETTEEEYLKDQRIQVSIFMSVWNVHINWYPVSGIVKFFKYHPGKYLLARHPKSSTLNERTTVVVETGSGISILFRQIAGAVARRVVCYAKINEPASSNQQVGFIKFGSRVDIFLPLGTEVLVKPGMRVTGAIDKIALLNKD